MNFEPPSRTFRDTALVLRTQKLGEADRIIILLTLKHGVVHAVAKGIRKSSSKFGARLEPFMLVDLSLVAGKNLHTVSQVQTKRAYTASLMHDFECYALALSLNELTESLVQYESEETEPYLTLLTGALSALSRRLHRPADIFTAFSLRAMQLAGWEFSSTACMLCGQYLDAAWFSAEPGLVCDTCTRESRFQSSSKVSAEMRTYLDAVYAGRWSEVDRPDLAPLSRQTFNLVVRYIQWHIEKPLKSLALLER